MQVKVGNEDEATVAVPHVDAAQLSECLQQQDRLMAVKKDSITWMAVAQPHFQRSAVAQTDANHHAQRHHAILLAALWPAQSTFMNVDEIMIGEKCIQHRCTSLLNCTKQQRRGHQGASGRAVAISKGASVCACPQRTVCWTASSRLSAWTSMCDKCLPGPRTGAV